MGIGGSIFLIAVGAILAFAVNWQPSGIDIHIVGWILILCGVVGLALTLYFWNRRRVAATAVVRERDIYHERTPPPPPPSDYR